MQKMLWKLINEVSKESKTQVIATTHSIECIKGALDAMNEDDEGDFAYYRISKFDGMKAFRFDRYKLDIAFNTELEVR